jgi:chemotaxis protein methyltransferase CheR
MTLEPKDEEVWEQLTQKITQITGFNCGNYTPSFLKRRVATRLYSLNLSLYKDYLDHLIKTPEEKELLLKELTIHVTNFFRNKEAFDVFIAETVMELLSEKKEKGDKSLKIWSAGCSTGEEPFSIAMILYEMLQLRIKDYNIKIVGSDISPQTIEQAKKGMYEEIQLKEAPKDYVEKYFEKKDDLYVIKPIIKDMVSFEVSDILAPFLKNNFDIIFCRNTVIYFTSELKEKLYMNFYNSLNNHGFFVMGMTESLTGLAREKFKTYNNSYRIYKKEE